MRQLILCCDGTNNNFTGGAADTHVVRLCELLAAQGDAEQCVYYDPGVGNSGALPGATWIDRLRRHTDRVNGLAFGRGLFENIDQGYRFLMRTYRPGDQIFVFGFSRGAFTARSIAGLVNRFGVLRPEAQTMVPTLLHVYFSKEPKTKEGKDRAEATARQIRQVLSHPVDTAVHFTGVWDTVASVGFKPFQLRITAKPTLANKRFIHVRQALALDEMRSQFTPRLYAEENGNIECAPGHGLGTLQQLWFRGCHCDVGGGYAPEDSRLARQPLAWLLSEAVQCGLRLRHAGRPLDTEDAVLAALPPPTGAPLIHSELQKTPLWALAGMGLRRPERAEVDDMPDPHVRPVEHHSVAEWPARFPRDTSWKHWKLGWKEVLMLVPFFVMPLLMLYLGGGLASLCNWLHWQLLWWQDARGLVWPRCDHVLWQLLLDIPFIAAWAWLVSSLAVRAFARRAGVRRAGVRRAGVRRAGVRRADSPRPAWLQLLGRAPMWAVLGDVGEDAFSALTLISTSFNHSTLATGLACVMSLFSALKLLALGGSALLIFSGLLPARRA